MPEYNAENQKQGKKVQFYYKDDLLWPSCYYLSMPPTLRAKIFYVSHNDFFLFSVFFFLSGKTGHFINVKNVQNIVLTHEE